MGLRHLLLPWSLQESGAGTQAAPSNCWSCHQGCKDYSSSPPNSLVRDGCNHCTHGRLQSQPRKPENPGSRQPVHTIPTVLWVQMSWFSLHPIALETSGLQHSLSSEQLLHPSKSSAINWQRKAINPQGHPDASPILLNNSERLPVDTFHHPAAHKWAHFILHL